MSGAWVAKKAVAEARVMGGFVAGDPSIGRWRSHCCAFALYAAFQVCVMLAQYRELIRRPRGQLVLAAIL